MTSRAKLVPQSWSQSANLPSWSGDWYSGDGSGTLLDLVTNITSSEAKLVDAGAVVKTVASSDMTRTDGTTSPNVIVRWPVGFFADVPEGEYELVVSVTDTNTNVREFRVGGRYPRVLVTLDPTPLP